jgi:hypothetical protein
MSHAYRVESRYIWLSTIGKTTKARLRYEMYNIYSRQEGACGVIFYHKYSHCGFVLLSVEAGISVKAMLVYAIC